MVIGFAVLTLLGIGLIVGLVDDDDSGSNDAVEEPDGVEVTGTDDADTIEGTEGTDLLLGGEGEDIITGDASSDTIEGGLGDDLIEGDGGNDFLLGGADSDIVLGEAGNDRASGGSGNDLVTGGAGDDTLSGSLGTDLVVGDAGNDEVRGGFGSDFVIGGAGADLVDGGANDDFITGGTVFGAPFSTEQLETIRDTTMTVLELIDEGTPATGLPFPDDNAPDTLIGGDGEDEILVGSGDEATGGSGADLFALIAEASDDGTDPSVITDFDPTEDGILILIESDGPVEPVIDVTTDGANAVVSVDGVPISILSGAADQVTSGDVIAGNGIFVGVVNPVIV